MSDPFLIDSPTCISFSGGRTSAYMLWRVLQSNGGLPPDTVVCFQNTGKEHSATYDFIKRCGEEWNVPILWLEFGRGEVNFDTASRNGEPFALMINQKGKPYLPNPSKRICTYRMKIEISHAWMDEKYPDGWVDVIGIRADESRRAVKMPHAHLPLYRAGITKRDVEAFWKGNSFDLTIPPTHSNCDLCFLKGGHQVFSLILEDPTRAVWWAKMENTPLATKPDGATFRKDRPSYAQMLKFSEQQRNLFDPAEETIPCFCGD